MSGNLYRVDVLQLLDPEATSLLSRWSEGLELDQDNPVSHEELVQGFRERAVLSRLVKRTREDLKNYDISMLPFLLPHQKIHLRQRLVRAHYLTSVQARIDEIEYRLDGLAVNRAQCARYASLIRAIDSRYDAREEAKSEQLQQLVEDSEKPMAWFAARSLVPFISGAMLDLCAGNTTAIRNLIIEIDKKDVYLGWSRSFILSFFNLLPQAFSGDSEYLESLRQAGVFFSYMNLITVNAVFAMECYLVLKNTFTGFFATRHQETHLRASELFLTQVYQRRFVLLNSFFLSFLNLTAFLCFSGVVNAWPWGPFFGISCRLIQLVLASARYRDEETSYNQNVTHLFDQINELNELEQRLLDEMSQLEDEDEKAMLSLKLKQVEEDRQSLQMSYRKTQYDWMIKSDEFSKQAVFSTCFFAGAMMFSCLVVPASILAPPIGLAIGFTGAVICITCVIASSVMRNDFANQRLYQEMLSIHHPLQNQKTAQDEQLDFYMHRFLELKKLPVSLETTLEMKQNYLRMLQLVSHSYMQMQLLEQQKVKLWMAVVRDTMLPLVALSMLIFAPNPLGLGAIIGLVVLYFLIEKAFQVLKPVMAHPVKFDEKAYEAFLEHPTVDKLSGSSLKIKEQMRLSSEPTQSHDNEPDDFISDFGGLGV